MCGIFAYLCRDPTKTGISIKQNISTIYDRFEKTHHRGPDKSTFSTTTVNRNMFLAMGFHRLSIIGLNNGEQPFCDRGVNLMVNGEIYNYKQLIIDYKLPVRSDSDCEVILQLYLKYGIEKTISLLDGVWAFTLYDSRGDGKMIFARDMYGVRPLFYGDSTNVIDDDDDSLFFKNNCGNQVDLVVGSQLGNIKDWTNCKPVEPRTIYTLTFDSMGYFCLDKKLYVDIIYRNITHKPILEEMNFSTELQAMNSDVSKLKSLFKDSVVKRLQSEQPLGFFLSGGLDSSLVLSVAMNYMYKEKKGVDFPTKIDVFTIGTKGVSDDIIAAEKLVVWLNKMYDNRIIHHIVDFDEFDVDIVSNVVKHLESWDTTTVRASVPMYLISKYASENTDVKVVLSGEGADELFGGYLYFHMAPSLKEFESESRRLLKDLYLYDGLRADRTTSAWGIELRVPFLDKEFTIYVMSLLTKLKVPIDGIEKHLLRQHHEGMLPDDILWRRKNGMSDGVGKKYQDWIQGVAREYFGRFYVNTHKSNSELEKEFYKLLFLDYFKKDQLDIIPYVWLPRWCKHVGDNPSGLLVLGDENP
jgi:asparagine synthase (glutamine-hydrolysing)